MRFCCRPLIHSKTFNLAISIVQVSVKKAPSATKIVSLKAGLTALMDTHPLIGDVRGRGLMVGVELVRDRATKERATEERDAVVNASFRRGLLILGAGKNAVRFSPPLVLTRDQADAAVRVFGDALTDVEKGQR